MMSDLLEYISLNPELYYNVFEYFGGTVSQTTMEKSSTAVKCGWFAQISANDLYLL